jgi:hypothetical protein
MDAWLAARRALAAQSELDVSPEFTNEGGADWVVGALINVRGLCPASSAARWARHNALLSAHSRFLCVHAPAQVAGNVLINLGTNVVKMGHNQDEETQRLGVTAKGRGVLMRLGGWSLFVLGSVMNFVSFSFAAQSLLAALGAVQFVANAIFARYCLHEPVSRRTIIATGGIVFGILMVLTAASHRNAVHTVQELMDLYLAIPYRTHPPPLPAAGQATAPC